MSFRIPLVDTHAHLDGDEFKDDLAEVVLRAKNAGIGKVFIPGIDGNSLQTVHHVCSQFPNFCYPMVGFQPEEVKGDWKEVLKRMYAALHESLNAETSETERDTYIAIGECGLDFYWSREYEKEQLAAFEEQVKWSVETQLPLMIHCRKAQHELLQILKIYEKELPGGVFHCFTGNQKEAEEYLRFEKFVLGVGGVSTFKSSHLRTDLPAAVPLQRIVLETDSPYMAPVPHRGQRNESAFIVEVCRQLAECYDVSEDEVARVTNENVYRIFHVR